MDTTSSGFWTAFSALKGRKREEDNQIRLIYRLFSKEPNTFNYGKKRFFALFFAVFLFLFVIIVPNAKAAAFWNLSSQAGYLSSIINSIFGEDNNQTQSVSRLMAFYTPLKKETIYRRLPKNTNPRLKQS